MHHFTLKQNFLSTNLRGKINQTVRESVTLPLHGRLSFNDFVGDFSAILCQMDKRERGNKHSHWIHV